MKEIKLTQGKVALVDDEDFEYLNQFKWYAQRENNTYYAVRSFNFKKEGKWTSKRIIMHRVIMNPEERQFIDHKNRNGLDNQRVNLRFCTRSENQKNKKPTGTSQYLGVCWHKSITKRKTKKGEIKTHKYAGWKASINIAGKTKHLGMFKNEIEAAKCYDTHAKIHHGQFANLNFKIFADSE